MAEIVAVPEHPARIYVRTAYGEPIVQDLKRLGAHWDPGRKQWWVGRAKAAQVADLVAGAAAARSAGTRAPAAAVAEDPDSIKILGKARYKGRTYYVRWAGVTKRGGYAMRLTTLDGSRDFWADAASDPGIEPEDRPDLAVWVKEYEPRTVGRGRWAREEYSTLGGLRRFAEQQRDPATRRGPCTECGHWGPSGEPCEECCGEGTHA